MADVTINQLPDLSTSSSTVVPISNGTVTGKTLTSNLGVPIGTIVMWSNYGGAGIPSGWQLCDGTNNTPDLRNRFVVGSGSSYSIGNTGGSADAIVVSHTHTATSTVTDPGHAHSYNWRNYSGGTGNGFANSSIPPAPVSTSSNQTGITVSTTINSQGSSGTNANLPPYYAVAFIIKIS